MKALTLLTLLLLTAAPTASVAAPMDDIFDADYRNGLVLRIEAAMARAQAEAGIIPGSAADEISRKASTQYAPLDEIDAEYDLVRHRMVALLNVWTRYLDAEAAEYVHFGATTVDIYDTVMTLQLLDATELILAGLLDFESRLLDLADEHADTIMIGRTLGQHALPITFGKKVSAWLGENRRHIERVRETRARLRRSAILKGAVGSYLGLGEQAIEVETAFARELGLDQPYLADWHGTRDVYAEYALNLGLIAHSLGRIGNELFLLQMTDIGETVEVRNAVGSSTMPHKNNPSLSEALVHYSRTVPRLAEVVADDVQNHFERDNTSRPNRVLEEISIEASQMLRSANRLIDRLTVNEDAMARNLGRTNQLIMSQRLVFELADQIGKTTANEKLHDVAKIAYRDDLTLGEAFRRSEMADLIAPERLEELLDPASYVGLAAEQTRRVVANIRERRDAEGR